MTIDLIVSDWNGTLFRPADDGLLNRSIAYAAFGDTLRALARGRLGRAPGILKAVKAKFVLGKAARRYRSGELDLAGMYAQFNRYVVQGMPVRLVHDVADRHGEKGQSLIDRRMVDAIAVLHSAGCATAIFSAAYDHGVRSVLRESGQQGVFDDVIANTLEEEGGVARGLTAHFRDRKSEEFQAEFLERRGFRPEGTVYCGDSEFDEPIAGLRPPGHFVVPFFASDAFKQRMKEEHGAFVPRTGDELKAYLTGL